MSAAPGEEGFIKFDEASDLGHRQDQCDGRLLLSASEVRGVSSAALSRWSSLLLVEDDSARSARRGAKGVLDRTDEVLLRVHRIGKSGLKVMQERTHTVGTDRAIDKADLALSLIDECRKTNSVIVSGATYGSSSQFLDGIYARNLDAVLEVRPSSHISRKWENGTGPIAPLPIRGLLESARWQRVIVPTVGSEAGRITYLVTRLGSGYLQSGHHGLFFAIQTGDIEGINPGTIFGFTQARRATHRQLIESVGWARWIRSVVRRSEKADAAGTRLSIKKSQPGDAIRTTPRLRSNIKSSTIQDEELAGLRSRGDSTSPLGVLGSSHKVLNVVELFAGAGGMGLGFLLAESDRKGYRLVCSGEVDPIYVRTLNRNHLEASKVMRLEGDRTPCVAEAVDLRSGHSRATVFAQAKARGGVDVLIGGPPCQGFSSANRNSWSSSNPHNQLVDVYLDYVDKLAPPVFVMENVQGIHWTQKEGLSHSTSSVLDHVRDRMEAGGYEVFVQLLDSAWYGVPQRRSRFFVVGIHGDLGYRAGDFGEWGPFPAPTHGPGTSEAYVTVREAIGDLPEIGNGSTAEEFSYAEPDPVALSSNAFMRFARGGASPSVITDHVTSRHADYVIDRYKQIPPGGNWQNIRSSLTNYADASRTHSNIYRRLSWDDPAITIGHYRKSMMIHPSQNRGLSLREAARLQSFPDWFRFVGSADGGTGGLVHKQQQLANAVSPLVAKAIAEFLLEL